ncbi:hypothetical protein [Yersinia mollaretii]|uniref:hypothetical protein n=1 Tax=Yersinia mollaretii TaxID=33060 RepID=UPI00119F9A03|nr:hypothetical protein [Yersinia mollaretii]
MSLSTLTATDSVEVILAIVAKKLAIDVEEAREKAIEGTLSDVAVAYYSRQQASSDKRTE